MLTILGDPLSDSEYSTVSTVRFPMWYLTNPPIGNADIILAPLV